ncbi:unnamed protein product, partial [Symbiodinium sp. KB8]
RRAGRLQQDVCCHMEWCAQQLQRARSIAQSAVRLSVAGAPPEPPRRSRQD